MSRTKKHPPKPDYFTKKHRTAAHQARSKRVLATLRHLKLDAAMDKYFPGFIDRLERRANETENTQPLNDEI